MVKIREGFISHLLENTLFLDPQHVIEKQAWKFIENETAKNKIYPDLSHNLLALRGIGANNLLIWL